MKYFLDTNVIIDMLRGKHPCMFRHFENTYSTDIYVPSVVVAELEYGAAHSADYEKNKSLYERFISNFAIIPFDKKCCKPYGKIRQDLNAVEDIQAKPKYLPVTHRRPGMPDRHWQALDP